MNRLTKIVLIILIIFAFALFISTFTFVLFDKTTTPGLLLFIGTISLCMCVLLNEEVLKHEISREVEDDETF